MPAEHANNALTPLLTHLEIKLLVFPLPGLDEPLAGVDHVLHLKVDGRVHDGQDQVVLKVEIRRVHEVQQDGQTLRVYFGV